MNRTMRRTRRAAMALMSSVCLLAACSNEESEPTNCASDAQCLVGQFCDIATLSDGSLVGICRPAAAADAGADGLDGGRDAADERPDGGVDAGGTAPDDTGYDVATVDVAGLLPDADDVHPDVPPTPHTCVPGGTGNIVGDQIADVVLQRCDGTSLNLHELCDGDGGAVWMIHNAMWDGAGVAYAPRALADIDSFRSRGVVPILFVGEDGSGIRATLDTCAEAAEVYGWPLQDVYVSAGEPGFYDLWEVVSPGSGGAVGLPFEAVLDRRGMQYVWNNANGGVAAEVVETLLR